MKDHLLKVWPEYYEKIRLKEKTFEIRKNDRDFKEGDHIDLREWNPDAERFTGRRIHFKIGYILHGGQFGIEERYCVLSLIKKS